jgi:hypothetical protein
MSQLPGDSNIEHIHDVNTSPVFERGWTPPSKVFLSCTSDLRHHPADHSYVEAACEAIRLAEDVPVHMDDFGAADNTADFCAFKVARCDVYVGIIGLQYGSPVRERPGISYTQLEFEIATRFRLPRLVFLVNEVNPRRRRQPKGHADRQLEFRRQLQNTVMVASVKSPHELEVKLLKSLVELHSRQ